MKSNLSRPLVEPLEARIAPALILIGAPLGNPKNTAADTEYDEGNPSPQFQKKFFVNTSTSTDAISLAVDSPLSTNTYYMRLDAGDEIQAFTDAQSYSSLIKVTAGHVIAFFVDKPDPITHQPNNDYDPGEFTGLAMGKDAQVVVSSNLWGDVVTNLNEHGTADTADDTLDMTGLVNSKQGIAKLEIRGGSVFGSIYSGGDIKSLFVANNVEKVLAGQAALGGTFDFFKGGEGGKGTLTNVNTPVGQIGASITNAVIGSLGVHPDPTVLPPVVLPAKFGHLEAGAGGIGAKGGSLTNIQITKDANGFQLLAGAGGVGDAGFGKIAGGAGGDLTTIYVSGLVDKTPNSPDPATGNSPGIVIKAGDGANATNTGAGGAGGKTANVFVGYQLNGAARLASVDLLQDNVLVASGNGGSGKTGGNGGLIDNVFVRVQTPDVNGDEIGLVAGSGGASVNPAGKAGAGGSITNTDLRNQVSSFNSDISLQAGNGGTTVGAGLGSDGGSILKSTVLGFDVQLIAGNGSDGKTGGLGGSIKNINIADGFSGSQAIVTHNALLNAGKGGNATNGNAGNGGVIDVVNSLKTDLQVLLVNTGNRGSGGTSVGGKGGNGGTVSNLTLTDADTGNLITGNVTVFAGSGGKGDKGGGNGGGLQKIFIDAFNANLTAASGAGGDATLLGNGGIAGSVNTVQLAADGKVEGVDVFGSLTAGVGGAGFGKGGAGGAGGDIANSNVTVDGAVLIAAGTGGSGEDAVGGGAAGRGGNINLTGGVARNASGELRAGNAGAGGDKPGNGGSILGNGLVSVSGLLASQNLTIVAGNGTNGGAGGDIKGIGYGRTSATLTPTPSGNILVQAGSGSGEYKVAGKGGSLDNIYGSVSSVVTVAQGQVPPPPPTTQFIAGDGGSTPAVGGIGGSVTNVSLNLGGGKDVVLTIKAGDAGDSPLAATGAKGGDVRGVGVFKLDAQAIFRSVAAGYGGDALKTGGLGGTIDQVSVRDHDIGLRTGAVFGYTAMGGLFAGLGGAGLGVGGKAGLNGNVTNINANSIASIVAGHETVPQMVEKAENIYLNGNKQLVARSNAFGDNGAFTLNYNGEQTTLIAKNASPLAVQNALNALLGIQAAGGVGVSLGPIENGAPSYRVVWLSTGAVVPLTGLEVQGTVVNEVVKGSIQAFQSSQVVAGGAPLTVTEATSGERSLSVLETVRGDTPVLAKEVTRGVDLQTQEVQLLDLSAISPYANGTVVLSFQGDTSTVQLPQQPTPGQIDAALENLFSVQALGTQGAAGAVTVTQSAPFVYQITFNIPQDVPDLVIADLIIPETQRLNLGSLGAFPTAQFDLSFKNGGATETTNKLTPASFSDANLFAAAIANELNNLPSIAAVGPVTVTPDQGTFLIQFANNIGDKPSILGHGYVPEVQTLKIGALPATAEIQLGYGDQFVNVPANSANLAAAIQGALNGLSTIQAGGGAVNVAATGADTYSVTFNTNGDKLPIFAQALQNEQQTLNLGTVGAAATGEYLLDVTHFVPVNEGDKGAQTKLAVQEQIKGDIGFLSLTTTVQGSNTVKEIQEVDLTGIAGIRGGEFQLSYNGLKTGFLAKTSTAGQIATALNGLGNIVGGVQVTQQAGTLLFDIAFNNTGNQPAITTFGGAREVQNVDLDQLKNDPTGEFLLHFRSDVTKPLASTATALAIQNELNAGANVAANGGVKVTAGPGNSFNIQFQTFGNLPSITSEGGGAVDHESQFLDLSKFVGVAATTSFNLSFGSDKTVALNQTATAGDIANALNNLTSVKNTRPAGSGVASGAVAVTETAPGSGKFIVDFNTFGDQPAISGLGGKDDPATPEGAGRTIRIDSSKTAAEVETEINKVALTHVSVTPGAAAGTFNVTYDGENADQPLLALTGFIHELQNVDVFAIGDFKLSFAGEETSTLPANATHQDVENALNALNSIKALRPDLVLAGKPVVTVTDGPVGSSSYAVVLKGDGDLNALNGNQFLPLEVKELHAGGPLDFASQQVAYKVKGNFNAATFAAANLVGGISDFNELGANIFKFIHNGVATNASIQDFQLGDTPIDGLVMAKFFNQTLVNFTPEAKFTVTGFFDNENLI
jgi:hypothetical protein